MRRVASEASLSAASSVVGLGSYGDKLKARSDSLSSSESSREFHRSFSANSFVSEEINTSEVLTPCYLGSNLKDLLGSKEVRREYAKLKWNNTKTCFSTKMGKVAHLSLSAMMIIAATTATMLFASPVLLSVGAVALVMLFPLGFTYLMKSMAYLLALKSGDIECDKDEKLKFVNSMAYKQISGWLEQLLEDQKGRVQRFSEIINGLLARDGDILKNLQATKKDGETFAECEDRLIEELRTLLEESSTVPLYIKVTFGGREYYFGEPKYGDFQGLELFYGDSDFSTIEGPISENTGHKDIWGRYNEVLEQLRFTLGLSFCSFYGGRYNECIEGNGELSSILENLKALFLLKSGVKGHYFNHIKCMIDLSEEGEQLYRRFGTI